jgi:hypothetical protein
MRAGVEEEQPPLEIWIPYGDVESLVTLQAENIGELIDPTPESHADELVQRLGERMKGKDRLIVCDYKPATVKLLKAISAQLPQDGSLKVYSPVAKRLEERVPDMKGRVMKLSPGSAALQADGSEVKVSPELMEGSKFVVSTGEPDPLFGYVDSRVALARACFVGTNRLAYAAREGDEPRFMQETKPYGVASSLADKLENTTYATVVTRGGEPYSVIDGGARDAQAHLSPHQLTPAKGVVVGAGGHGYDETFSHALRLVVGALKGLRKGGEMVIVGECRDGIGSEALQMYAMGRITESMLRKGFYADGMEEIAYLERLKQQYSVTLISSLPELYASGRFRFRGTRSSAEAMGKVFASVGRSAKLHVVTRSPETFVA